MAYEFTPVALPYIAATIICIVLLSAIWRHRDRRGAKGFMLDVVGVILLSITVVLQLLSTGESAKLFWWNWRFLAESLMTIGYLLMAIEYTNNEEYITYRTGAVLAAVPILTQFAAWTNGHHGWFYAATIDPTTGFLIPTFEPLYWVYATTMMAYLGIGVYLLVRLFRSLQGFEKQAGILIATILFVVLGLVLWWFTFVTVETLALTSMVKVVGFYFAVDRLQLLDIVPVARTKVIDNMQDAVFVVNAANRIVDVNPSAERLAGNDVAVGDALAETFPSSRITEFDDVSDAQSEISVEIDGETRYFALQISPLTNSRGTQTGRLIVLRDVTQLKNREQELTVLNRIVRHDIRNEMNVITGRSELLDEHIDPAGEEHLELIRESSNHVVELTRVVGDLVETLTTDGDLDLEPVHLGPVVWNQVEKARTSYPHATFDIDGMTTDVTVLGNEMLSSVFTNLLNNAVLHNDAASPHVRVSIEDGDEVVRVRVSDNGPGVPEAQRDEIFGRGQKGLESEGTGIGLYLVDTLVDGYGGDVWVESSDEAGATFAVELPKATDGRSRHASSTEDAEDPRPQRN
ncbi:histidine kinase N-terminal 7TM domain-containing protein [Natrinema salaciae]|uniref:histidine kinase n=1 Tax=Natrinema salaciae TaxID=1186196 RepID=A0A1H9BCN2_9EURY|nr:histidine kinase N-terminal 7TM domain-containing protein [Natrinema salaciae]SEP86629.1 PAS domain S-box-containing protein [Natrinema salaciae]